MKTSSIVTGIVRPPVSLYPMEEAFPEMDCGVKPFGQRIVVQMKCPRRKTASGLLLSEETRETDKDNTQVAKVVAIGPLAFKTRDKAMEGWPEGDWFKVGDFVRVPRYGGDRWWMTHPADRAERVEFAMFIEREVCGLLTVDPRTMAAYLE